MADLKVFAKTVEQEVYDQLKQLMSVKVFKDAKIQIMPDTHAGKGCVIGFTANLGDKVVPNLVGVDVGCGCYVVNMGKLNLSDCNNVELIFKFENIIAEDDKPMYDISKYIKEYKDRNNKCKFCAYHNVQGGRCYTCKSYNWFVQEIDLKQFVIRRVTEDSEKEFRESDEAIQLNAKIDLRKNVYDDFSKYVEKQKEILYKELEDKYDELSSLKNEYIYKGAKFISDNIDKALASLDTISD